MNIVGGVLLEVIGLMVLTFAIYHSICLRRDLLILTYESDKLTRIILRCIYIFINLVIYCVVSLTLYCGIHILLMMGGE